MSYEARNCLRCQSPMELGYVVDSTESGWLMQGRWIEGLPEKSLFLGMNTGSLTIKDRKNIPLLAYRCSACSHVEFFAFEAVRGPAELLRAAADSRMGANELVRGSGNTEEIAAVEIITLQSGTHESGDSE